MREFESVRLVHKFASWFLNNIEDKGIDKVIQDLRKSTKEYKQSREIDIECYNAVLSTIKLADMAWTMVRITKGDDDD